MLLNWIRRRLYERKRFIFRYWDGARMRAADPIRVYRDLQSHKTFLPEKHLALADQGDLPAIQITVDATREVFGVPAWSETQPGLTVDETMALINGFCLYLDSQKKSGSPSPISSEPTAPESLPPNSGTTNAPSACGSMPSASNSVEPATS